MSKLSNSKTRLRVLRNYFWALLALWTTLVGLVLLWSLAHQRIETEEAARIQGRAAFEKDLVYRRWVASHGGVYVPVTEQTSPNLYLSGIEERDIITPSGRVLTLINPAYMTRQVHEIGAEQYGLRGHITSLKPIRPANAADEWETKALRAFERGAEEVSSIEKLDNEDYMRLMCPMITEQACLRCHAEQGYKVGDLRGGISVSVPMAPLRAIASGQLTMLALGHGVLWLLGVSGISIGGRHLRQRIREREQVEEQIREQSQFLRSTIDSLAHPFYVIDANDYTIKIANSAAHTDAVNGISTCYALAHKKDKPCGSAEHPCPLEIIKKSKQPVTVEHIHYDKDGNARNFEVHGFPIFDDQDNVVQIIEYCLDITERKKASEEITRLAKFPAENPNPVLRVAKGGTILYSNESSSPILELWRCQQGDQISDEWHRLILETLDTGKPQETEAECDGMIYSLTFAPVKDGDFVNVYGLNITERKQTEKALAEARDELEQRVQERTAELVKANEQLIQKIEELQRTEETLRESEQVLRQKEQSLAKAQRIAHLGNWDWNIVTNELLWSDEIYRIFGLQPREFGATYEAFLKVVHPDDRDTVEEAVNKSLADGNKSYSIEHRVVQPDSSERVVHERGEVAFDKNGKAVRMIGTVHDITEQKRAEEALRNSESALRKSQDNLRVLAGKLLSVQEEERRLLAREMHDDLTQRLAVLAIEFGKVEQQRKSSPESLRNTLKRIKEQIVKLSADVHDISRQLHPAIIDDLGLVDAIKSECTSFSKREDISIRYEPANIPDTIPKDVALCIYRIMQESLRNIAKHAKVNEAEVLLTGSDGGIGLCVKDSGTGFDPANVHSKRGLGLASMEERVRLIQGELLIQSQPGQGTVIKLWAPLPGRSE
ncbi:MAG: PAS domain-containing protein [Planctomycetota bacterium]|jgi:PAS domain S-box-containing protein